MRIIAFTTSIVFALTLSAFAEGDIKKGAKVFKNVLRATLSKMEKTKLDQAFMAFLTAQLELLKVSITRRLF